MRILIASLVAVTAVAFAAPSFAQEASPTPTPTTKSKPRAGTAAYCNTLKSESAKASCHKRVQTASAKSHKTKKPAKQPAADSSAQLSAPVSAAPAPVMPAPTQQGQVAVPPLPQKTI